MTYKTELPPLLAPCGGRTGADMVNAPPHYRAGDTYETIRVIEAWRLGFCLGNTVKYISRAGAKGDALEDLKKAAWYLAREIAARESNATPVAGAPREG